MRPPKCPHCDGRNTEEVDDGVYGCFDCQLPFAAGYELRPMRREDIDQFLADLKADD